MLIKIWNWIHKLNKRLDIAKETTGKQEYQIK